MRAGVTLAEPESGATGKEKDSQFVNTPDVSAAFVGHLDILGVIVREMNRLNIPTRYEPVGRGGVLSN